MNANARRVAVLLPAVVSFAEARQSDNAIAFGVRDAKEGTSHLDGIVRQPASGSAAAS